MYFCSGVCLCLQWPPVSGCEPSPPSIDCHLNGHQVITYFQFAVADYCVWLSSVTTDIADVISFCDEFSGTGPRSSNIHSKKVNLKRLKTFSMIMQYLSGASQLGIALVKMAVENADYEWFVRTSTENLMSQAEGHDHLLWKSRHRQSSARLPPGVSERDYQLNVNPLSASSPIYTITLNLLSMRFYPLTSCSSTFNCRIADT